MRSVCWTAPLVALAVALVVPAQSSAQTPAATSDLARTLDAEVRVALFELVEGRELSALSRLEGLAALVERDSSTAVGPERAAFHFLLAQSYHRLGMLGAFRRSADAALSAGGAGYASVLRPQLIVEAYRSGDYARATTLARELPVDQMSGATALVAGLAAYRTGELGAARASFRRAIAAGGDDAHYAQYMDALTTLRADTTQAASAIASLEAAASGAPGDFADQVRLTAAQVAYEGERYGDAARIAATVDSTGALAAPALLTRAWALYKLEEVGDAERAFSEFAAKFPGRPERDEARLMVAQAQLELGRAAEAERLFEQVADSSAADIAALKAETNAAIADVARALVTDRLAHVLVPGDPATTKTLVLRDSVSAMATLAVVTGTELPSGQGEGTPSIAPAVATTDARRRLDSLATRAPASVTRVLFAPASATRQPQELAARSQSLVAADAAVAVARVRLEEQLAAQQREIGLLARLAALLDLDSAAVAAVANDYRAAADSLTRLDGMMAAAEARLRELLGREIDATRTIAAENARTADSLRTTLAAGASPEDREALEAEVATASAYSRIADIATKGLDNAIARHPTFVMRDSVRAHAARAQSVLAELESSYGSSRRDIASALSSLRGGDAPATSAARKALADAEARRASIEGEVIAAVTAELSARAGELVAALQRDVEAAQFGVASATFFRAIDGTRTVGATNAPQRRR
ncbi:MAG TPA: hypothetical protein VFZ21_20845 [Gemmatimonadaceae bacterium]|nr:hypothetical protein [Gemmatimonadaceae bacterium]